MFVQVLATHSIRLACLYDGLAFDCCQFFEIRDKLTFPVLHQIVLSFPYIHKSTINHHSHPTVETNCVNKPLTKIGVITFGSKFCFFFAKGTRSFERSVDPTAKQITNFYRLVSNSGHLHRPMIFLRNNRADATAFSALRLSLHPTQRQRTFSSL